MGREYLLENELQAIQDSDSKEAVSVAGGFALQKKIYQTKIAYILTMPALVDPQEHRYRVNPQELKEVYNKLRNTLSVTTPRKYLKTFLAKETKNTIYLDTNLEQSLGHWSIKGDIDAYDILLESNIKYALFLAREIAKPAIDAGVVDEDEVNAWTCELLIEVAQKYDGAHKSRLVSFLVKPLRWRIMGLLKKHKLKGMTPVTTKYADGVKVVSLDDNEFTIATNKGGSTFENNESITPRDRHTLIGSGSVDPREQFALQQDVRSVIDLWLNDYSGTTAAKVMKDWIANATGEEEISMKDIALKNDLTPERVRQIVEKNKKKIARSLKFYGYGPKDAPSLSVEHRKVRYKDETTLVSKLLRGYYKAPDSIEYAPYHLRELRKERIEKTCKILYDARDRVNDRYSGVQRDLIHFKALIQRYEESVDNVEAVRMHYALAATIEDDIDALLEGYTVLKYMIDEQIQKGKQLQDTDLPLVNLRVDNFCKKTASIDSLLRTAKHGLRKESVAGKQ